MCLKSVQSAETSCPTAFKVRQSVCSLVFSPFHFNFNAILKIQFLVSLHYYSYKNSMLSKS